MPKKVYLKKPKKKPTKKNTKAKKGFNNNNNVNRPSININIDQSKKTNPRQPSQPKAQAVPSYAGPTIHYVSAPQQQQPAAQPVHIPTPIPIQQPAQAQAQPINITSPPINISMPDNNSQLIASAIDTFRNNSNGDYTSRLIDTMHQNTSRIVDNLNQATFRLLDNNYYNTNYFSNNYRYYK